MPSVYFAPYGAKGFIYVRSEFKNMSDQELIEAMEQSFQKNPIAGLCVEAACGFVDPTPRTLEGIYPGNKTRAMGHALASVEGVEECGEEAEREYIDQVWEDPDSHRIDIHINGGSDENRETIDVEARKKIWAKID